VGLVPPFYSFPHCSAPSGKLGDNFYVVESGEFDISVCKTVGGPSIVVAKRGAGQSFGELALLYNAPRAATIKATKVRFWGEFSWFSTWCLQCDFECW
jgi:hypothetical protein